MNDTPDCKGCGASVRVAPREVERLVAEYFRGREVKRADAQTYERRLEICKSCPSLSYGTTCRYCGCLVAVRALIAEKGCPGLPERWGACCESRDMADNSDAGSVAGSFSPRPVEPVAPALKD